MAFGVIETVKRKRLPLSFAEFNKVSSMFTFYTHYALIEHPLWVNQILLSFYFHAPNPPKGPLRAAWNEHSAMSSSG